MSTSDVESHDAGIISDSDKTASKAAKTPQAHRRWAFTINNPTEVERANLIVLGTSIGSEGAKLIFIMGQLETGKEGTPHFQGYLELKRRQRMGGVKKVLDCQRAHLEPAKFSAEVNIEYCSKEEGRLEPGIMYGKFVIRGQRTDIEDLHHDLQRGRNNAELWDDNFGQMLKYHKAVDRYRLSRLTKRTEKGQVIVLYGPPGTGKTRYAYELAAELGSEVYRPTCPNGSGLLWWDDYAQEKVVLLDDFYGYLQWTVLLQLLDRYAIKIQSKGGSIPFNSPRIVITSNSAMEFWYLPKVGREFSALVRRVTSILWREKDGDPWTEEIEDYKADAGPSAKDFVRMNVNHTVEWHKDN